MKPLYSDHEFNHAKSRDKLPFKCGYCSKPFFIEKHRIQSRTHGELRKFFEFCSLQCTYAARSTSITASCRQCGLPVSRLACNMTKSKSGNMFCSHSCSAKWNNAHKTKGTRVSKFERWLAIRLPELYPTLEFHFNRTDAINGELDIYIPSLKLAFELNGIFHYEPIYGPDKLAKIQSNDCRKFQACIEHGIELCIIDMSSLKYFKPDKIAKFLDIIINTIKLRIL